MATEVMFYEDFKHNTEGWPEGCDATGTTDLFKKGTSYMVKDECVPFFKKLGVAAPVGEEQPELIKNEVVELHVYDSYVRTKAERT